MVSGHKSVSFVAAMAQEPSVTGSEGEVADAPGVDLYAVMMRAAGKQSLERELLESKVVIEPMLDRYGGVSDFRVTLAQEGREVNASSLVSPDKLRAMLDRWEALTKQTPSYKLAIERDHRKQLVDIIQKLDNVSPKFAPRTPCDISFRSDGTVETVSYINNKDKYISLIVDPDNYIRWQDGSALNLTNGRFYEPRLQKEQKPQISEERGGGMKIR